MKKSRKTMIKNYLHSLGRSSMHICSKIGGNVLWKWTIKHSQHACNTCKKKKWKRHPPPFHVTLNHLWFIVNTHARRAADLYWKGSQRCKNSRNFVACHLRIFNINHLYRGAGQHCMTASIKVHKLQNSYILGQASIV